MTTSEEKDEPIGIITTILAVVGIEFMIMTAQGRSFGWVSLAHGVAASLVTVGIIRFIESKGGRC